MITIAILDDAFEAKITSVEDILYTAGPRSTTQLRIPLACWYAEEADFPPS